MRKTLFAAALMGAAALAFAGDGAGSEVTVNYYFSQPASQDQGKLTNGNFGLGARYGYSFNQTIEWDGGVIWTKHDLRSNNSLKNDYKAVTSDVKFNFPIGNRPRTGLYFGLGLGYNKIESDVCYFGPGAPYAINASGRSVDYNNLGTLSGKTRGCTEAGNPALKGRTSNSGFLWEWAAGANIGINENWAINIDARQHHYNDDATARGATSNFVNETFLGIGLGYGWGSGPCKDADGDGVCDGNDKCPNTPAGAKVDARGCPTDEDGDGVPDGLDKCPGTPKGAKVDANGCEMDDDGDGVVNSKDKCPNTPRGAKVDANGCPTDEDGDGVFDGLDRCPGTPKGVKVDPTGCPLDSDGDGIPDYLDKCPGTPKGTSVDPTGCAKKVTPESIAVLSGTDLRFASGSAVIPKAAYTKLDEFAGKVSEWTKAHPNNKIEISGHTDSVGKKGFNQQLSARRAAAVKAYLVKKGVSAGQLTTKGYGPDKPVADNTSPEGRAQNRRVEAKQAM